MQYLEKIMAYWSEGNVSGALHFYRKCRVEGLLAREDIERLDKVFPDPFNQLMEALKNPDPRIIFNLMDYVKKKRNWNDKELSDHLKIKMEDISRIRRMEPVPKNIRYKLFVEGFM